MKRRLDALEARLSPPVDERPEPREPVDAAEVLRVLYEAHAFPPHIYAAIEADDANAGALFEQWLERSVQ